ncbi:MAG: tyrosine-type recombinase/integrase [bacterium]
MAKLLYGSGLRLLECIRLRIKDMDFGQGLIFVRGGKGGKDRTTILPRNLHTEIYTHVMSQDIQRLQSPLDRLPG